MRSTAQQRTSAYVSMLCSRRDSTVTNTIHTKLLYSDEAQWVQCSTVQCSTAQPHTQDSTPHRAAHHLATPMPSAVHLCLRPAAADEGPRNSSSLALEWRGRVVVGVKKPVVLSSSRSTPGANADPQIRHQLHQITHVGTLCLTQNTPLILCRHDVGVAHV
jgi:hypothetical protein